MATFRAIHEGWLGAAAGLVAGIAWACRENARWDLTDFLTPSGQTLAIGFVLCTACVVPGALLGWMVRRRRQHLRLFG